MSPQKPLKEQWQTDRAIDGQSAITDFRLLGRQGSFFQIEALPKTGRTHQIRIHAAASPLVLAQRSSLGRPGKWLLHFAHSTSLRSGLGV